MGKLELNLEMEQDLKNLIKEIIRSYSVFANKKIHSKDPEYQKIGEDREEHLKLFAESLSYWLNITNNNQESNPKISFLNEISAIFESIKNNSNIDYIEEIKDSLYIFIIDIFKKVQKGYVFQTSI
ncbi:TPA: hypothetical protein ACG3P3_001587 [Clostridioides difficile]